MTEALLIEMDAVERVFGGGRTLFGTLKPAVHAVQQVSLDVRPGETLGVVGESGCGKSTLARMIAGLDRPTGGTIRFKDKDLAQAARNDFNALARQIQYVFQDPVSSLNPRKTIRAILEAPLVHLLGLKRAARRERLDELMDAVNLRAEFLDRYPHEFSGGQAQRIGIARALAASPELIVLDEPVSALDVSVQASVLELLGEIQREHRTTMLFISHDLGLVRYVADRVMVMYLGHVVETGTTAQVFGPPYHPYTEALLSAVPVADPARGRVRIVLEGDVPSATEPPPGCPFQTRCHRKAQVPDGLCERELPALRDLGDGHRSRCHLGADVLRAMQPVLAGG
jgi:oligopeptide/dipeptide ABC transporter ATP-binding protein